MNMNDGRKVDKSLYKNILTDINNYYGGDSSLVNDDIVEKTWDSTSGNLEKLLKKLAVNSGGYESDVTPDYMEKVKDHYGIVDPNYTKSTLDYMGDEEKAMYLPEKPDKHQMEVLGVSLGAMDDLYKQEGRLTPRQKEGLFLERIRRKESDLIAKGMNPMEKDRELYNYAKKVSNDLGMVYDASVKGYVVPKEERERYQFLLASTYMDPKEVEKLEPSIDNMKAENNKIMESAKSFKEQVHNEEIMASANVPTKERVKRDIMASINPEAVEQERLVKNLETNAAYDLAKNTSETLDLLERLKESGKAGDLWKGTKKGFVDHFRNTLLITRNFLQTSKVTNINNKLNDIHQRVMTEHPEWEYRDRPMYSNGELVPADDESSVIAKQRNINDEVNRIATEELTDDEINTLNAYSLNIRALEQLNKETGTWFNIGSAVGGSFGFMTEFALTGGVASTARTLATKGIAKGLTKIASTNMVKALSDTRVMASIAKGVTKAGSTKVGNAMVKGGNWLVKNSTETALQTLIQPTFMANVSSDIAKGAGVKEAVFNNFGDLFVENMTERLFTSKKPMYDASKPVSGMKKLFDQFMYRSGRADYGKRSIVKKVLGYVEEASEEKIGDLIRGGWTAIDRGEYKYLTQEIYKPEDVEMLASTAIMTAGFGILGMVSRVGAPKSTETLRYQENRLGAKIPAPLRESIVSALSNPDLSLGEVSTIVANEINGGVSGYFDESTPGGEMVKKRKELASDAMKYASTVMQLNLREMAEKEYMETGEEEVKVEGDKFTYNGKEVTITDTEMKNENEVEIVDSEGNKSIVEFDKLVPVEEVKREEVTGIEPETKTAEEVERKEETAVEEKPSFLKEDDVLDVYVNRERTEKRKTKNRNIYRALDEAVDIIEKGEWNQEASDKLLSAIEGNKTKLADAIRNKLKNTENAKETNGLRPESKVTKPGQEQRKESKPVGGMPEVNRVEGTFEEGEEVDTGLESSLKELNTKIRSMNQAATSGAVSKRQDVIKQRIRNIKNLVKDSGIKIDAKRLNKIMSKLSRTLYGEKGYNRVVNEVREIIQDQIKEEAAKNVAKSVKSAKKYVKKNIKSKEQQEKLDTFLNLDTSKMDEGDLSLFRDVVDDIRNGRMSELTSYLVDNYFNPEELEAEPLTAKQVENHIKSIEKKLNFMKETIDEPDLNDMIKYFRVLSGMRSKAARMYRDGLIGEDVVSEINGMIDSFMEGEDGMMEKNNAAREKMIDVVNMEMEDAIKSHPLDEMNPESVTVNNLYTRLGNIDTLNNRQLMRLYNALYNLNNGFYTKELNSALVDLMRHEVVGNLKEHVIPVFDKSADLGRFTRWQDRQQDLGKDLSVKDMNTAEYLFWQNEGTPFYDNIYQPIMEPASIGAEAIKAKMLDKFSNMISKLAKFYSMENAFTSKGQTYRDLVGMIMAEQDYQQNTLNGELDKYPEAERSRYKKSMSQSMPNKAWRKRYSNLGKYLVYDDRGFIDPEASFKNIEDLKDRKLVKDIFNEARNILDGPLKDYNKINAINHGFVVDFYDSFYFPRQAVSGSLDIPVIESLEDMTKSNFGGNLGVPNAIKARTGGFTLIELDIAKVINNAVDEATIDFYNVNAYNAVTRGINNVAREEEKSGKENASLNSMILKELNRSTKDRIVSVYHLEKRNNDMNGILGQTQRYINSASRVNMLVNAPKLATEVLTNWVGAMISDGLSVNVKEAVDNVYQVRDMRPMFDFYHVADSGTMMKYSEITRAAAGRELSANQKMIDKWIRLADKITSTNIYIKHFNKKFKELQGEELDMERWENDDKYKRDITNNFMKAHGFAVNQAQLSFSTIAPVSQATHAQILPSWTVIGKKTVVDRDNFVARATGFMLSFAMKEAELIGIGIRQMNYGMWHNDKDAIMKGMTLAVSRIVRSFAYPLTKPALVGLMASMWAGSDDDDNRYWIDMPERLLKVTTQNMASLLFGRYGNVAQTFESLVLGCLRLAENDGLLSPRAYDNIKSIMGYLSYAKPLSPKSIPTDSLISEVLPGIGFFAEVIADNYENMWVIADKLNSGKSLTSDEQELYSIAGSFFALLTYIMPNVLTANLYSIGTQGAAYKRRVAANSSRDKKQRDKLKNSGVSWQH